MSTIRAIRLFQTLLASPGFFGTSPPRTMGCAASRPERLCRPGRYRDGRRFRLPERRAGHRPHGRFPRALQREAARKAAYYKTSLAEGTFWITHDNACSNAPTPTSHKNRSGMLVEQYSKCPNLSSILFYVLGFPASLKKDSKIAQQQGVICCFSSLS